MMLELWFAPWTKSELNNGRSSVSAALDVDVDVGEGGAEKVSSSQSASLPFHLSLSVRELHENPSSDPPE